MPAESGHGLRVQLATALRELDEAKANTHGWLSVVEQLRENLNATLLERDDLKEALAAARRALTDQRRSDIAVLRSFGELTAAGHLQFLADEEAQT